MNNGGWGLKSAIFFIIVMCLSILVTMIMYNRTITSLFGADPNSLTYGDIEDELLHAARNYTNNFYYKVLEDGDNDYVTVKSLEQNKIINTIKDPRNKDITCTGYVNFYRQNGQNYYAPYLKCGNNYQTLGYRAEYDA